MNELERIRAELQGIRALADAAISRIDALMERTNEPEPETPQRPRFMGDDDPQT